MSQHAVSLESFLNDLELWLSERAEHDNDHAVLLADLRVARPVPRRPPLAALEPERCGYCGSTSPITCPHCGVRACADCQADAHGQEPEQPWRCDKAPAPDCGGYRGEPDDDISW